MHDSRPYFVLAGGYDTKNVGDYAMLKFLQDALAEREINIKLLTRHRHSQLRDHYGVEMIDNCEYSTRSESRGKFFRGFNWGEGNQHLQEMRRQLEESRGLIIGGGRLLIDYTLDVMRGPLPYFGSLVTLCRYLNVPVFVYAMTIVPNQTEPGRQWLRFIVDNADSVSVRDEESLAVLRQIGCQQQDLQVLPDPAFGLAWRRGCGGADPPRAALSVRSISDRWGGLSRTEYLAKMAGIVEGLQRRGFSVMGIPHQYYGLDDSDCDDRNLLKEISQLIPFEYVREEMLDLNDYQNLYVRINLLVGIRRHSFVFAGLSGVPIVPFSENPNASRLCGQLDTVPPLALDCSMDHFEDQLDRVLEQPGQVVARQDSALQQVSKDLKARYQAWLLGR